MRTLSFLLSGLLAAVAARAESDIASSYARARSILANPASVELAIPAARPVCLEASDDPIKRPFADFVNAYESARARIETVEAATGNWAMTGWAWDSNLADGLTEGTIYPSGYRSGGVLTRLTLSADGDPLATEPDGVVTLTCISCGSLLFGDDNFSAPASHDGRTIEASQTKRYYVDGEPVDKSYTLQCRLLNDSLICASDKTDEKRDYALFTRLEKLPKPADEERAAKPKSKRKR